MGCGCLAFVVALRSGSMDAWLVGVYMVWVGIFSLCGCGMMSGLLPRIYSYNSVSCTYSTGAFLSFVVLEGGLLGPPGTC